MGPPFPPPAEKKKKTDPKLEQNARTICNSTRRNPYRDTVRHTLTRRKPRLPRTVRLFDVF